MLTSNPETPTPKWTEEDFTRAERIWAEYQREHDVTHLKGHAAGIDPVTGRVWIGESGIDVLHARDADGVYNPLYLVRVGYDYFQRKGRR